MDECRSLVDVPAAEAIAPQRYDEVVAAAALRWMTERKREFEAVLRPHVGDVADGVNVIDLAISVFVCAGPGGWEWRRQDGSVRLLRYPDVLGHRCLRWREFEMENDSYANAAHSFRHDLHDSESCRSDLYVSPSAVDHQDTGMVVRKTRAIVAELGLDPRSATFDELQQCGRRLRCLKCVEEGREDYVYTWEAALSHSLCGPKGWKSQFIVPLHDSWELVAEDQMQRVRQLEKTAHVEAVGDPSGSWFCALCYYSDSGWEALNGTYRHLVTSHQIQEPEDVARKNKLLFSGPGHRCMGICVRPPVLYPDH